MSRIPDDLCPRSWCVVRTDPLSGYRRVVYDGLTHDKARGMAEYLNASSTGMHRATRIERRRG